MKTISERNLKRSAKNALRAGPGKHGTYAVDYDGNRRFVAKLDKTGRAMVWIEVLKDSKQEAKR